MGTKELIKKVKESTKLDITLKDLEKISDAIFITILESVKADEKVSIQNFGIFKKGNRKEKMGRNPQTGGQVKIPAKNTFKFTAAKYSKDIMNK